MKKAAKTVYVQQRNPVVSVLANLIMYTSLDIFETCQVNRRAEFERTKIIVAMSSYTLQLKDLNAAFVSQTGMKVNGELLISGFRGAQ